MSSRAAIRLAYALLACTTGFAAGSVTSQGDLAVRADQARAGFGVDGSGVTVGVLSDSFDCAGTEVALDLASGDLPPETTVLDDTGCPGSDRGRAVAQIVHDVAPGAAILFRTGDNGAADAAAGILQLAEAGAGVILVDLLYVDEPMFQDGPLAQAIENVIGSGVPVLAAAGDDGRRSYEAPFRPSGVPVLYGGDAHDFDPGPAVDVYQSITIPLDGELTLGLQWDEPFLSVSGAPGSSNDLDVCLMDDPPTVMIACGDQLNVGGDPAEVLSFSNDGAFGTEFNIVVELFEGPVPGVIKYILFGEGAPNEFDTGSSTLFGYANSAWVEAVGAAFYFDTPVFGSSPAIVGNDSSLGGTPILFDAAGSRLAAPALRPSPGLVAPDGTNNTFFGADIADPGDRSDKDHLPNFFGTSSAAAHAAGVAALLLDRNGALSPVDVYTALETTAADMDDPATAGFDAGFDFATGSGLIVADAALGSVPDCGDTIVELPEECDDGNAVDDDACGNDCRINACRDGVLHPNNGEECDDGNAVDDDFCRNDCSPNFCGDGRTTNFTGDLIANGDFESGTLAGWEPISLGPGSFTVATPGADTPTGAFATAANAIGGSHYALSDQPDAGVRALVQGFAVPPNASSIAVEFQMFVNDQSGSGPIVDPVGLDHTGPPNQHARVDLLSAGSAPLDTGAGVVAALYVGVDSGPLPNPYVAYAFDLSGVLTPGSAYRLRFAEVDNQLFLHQGVDNVRLLASLLEECDDGNTVPGDGCGADCTLEACAAPDEVAGLRFLADHATLEWNVGAATDSYDVLRSDGMPVGPGRDEACVAPAWGQESASDSAEPLPGSLWVYLVRGRNGCGVGTYGWDSAAEAERSSPTCPP